MRRTALTITTHKLPGREFAAVMSAHIAVSSESMYHLLGQSLISVDGDTAGAETYFHAVSVTTGSDGVHESNHLGGRFVDTIVREDGTWKIRRRVVVRDWTITLPIKADWTPATFLTPGLRSQEDPAFAGAGDLPRRAADPSRHQLITPAGGLSGGGRGDGRDRHVIACAPVAGLTTMQCQGLGQAKQSWSSVWAPPRRESRSW